MSRTVTWHSRADPSYRSERFPRGVKSEEFEVTLSDEEDAWLSRMRTKVERYPRGSEARSALLNEIAAFMEMKHYLGACLIDAVFEQSSPTDALLHVESLESRGFKIPASVKRDLAAGQLRLDEPGATGLEAVRDPLEYAPDFDGATYERERDLPRLFPQLQRVGEVMRDGQWRTLQEIQDGTGDPQASISARLRDLRKPKFGAHVLEREHVKDGLHRYRLLLNPQTAFPLGYGDPTIPDDDEVVASA